MALNTKHQINQIIRVTESHKQALPQQTIAHENVMALKEANIHWGGSGVALIKKRIKGVGKKVYNVADRLFYLPVFLSVINMRIRLT